MTALWTNIKPISSSPCSPLTSDCSVNQHKTYLITTLATPIWLFCGPTQNLSHHICHSHLTALWMNTKLISSPHLPLPSDCSVDQHKTCLITTLATPIWLFCGPTQNLSHHLTCHSHLTALWTNKKLATPIWLLCGPRQHPSPCHHTCCSHPCSGPTHYGIHRTAGHIQRPAGCAHHGIHKPLGHTHHDIHRPLGHTHHDIHRPLGHTPWYPQAFRPYTPWYPQAFRPYTPWYPQAFRPYTPWYPQAFRPYTMISTGL